MSRHTLRKIHAIWRRREASNAVSAEDVAWQDLARCLDPVSIGEAPRKSTPGMRAVVRAARSLGGAVAASVDGEAGKAEVPAAALQAVVEAMRFYYVLPAATTFRALALQASLSRHYLVLVCMRGICGDLCYATIYSDSSMF